MCLLIDLGGRCYLEDSRFSTIKIVHRQAIGTDDETTDFLSGSRDPKQHMVRVVASGQLYIKDICARQLLEVAQLKASL